MTAKGKNNWKEWIIDAAIALVIVVIIASFFRVTTVQQTSMTPSIQPGDCLLISRQAYHFSQFKRGDIVVFSSRGKGCDTKSRLLVKRVIGVPRDIITVSKGRVWLNGSKVKESYIASGETQGAVHNVIVPRNQLFVMGDHRSVSMDSRTFGCIRQDCVKGKAVARLFPFTTAGVL